MFFKLLDVDSWKTYPRCRCFFLQEIAASYDVVDGPNDEGATVVITFVEENFC